MFDRIVYQLVKDHRKRLDCAGAQPNAFRSVERNRSTVSHTNGLRGQFGIDQFVKSDPAAIFCTKEQPLRAA